MIITRFNEYQKKSVRLAKFNFLQADIENISKIFFQVVHDSINWPTNSLQNKFLAVMKTRSVIFFQCD